MSAVEKYAAPTTPDISDRQWALMERKARVLASSSLVPTAYRGKPEDIMCVALTARDLGMDLTVTTLAQFFVVEGRVTPSAQLMIGLSAAHGHELWVQSSDDQQATVCIQRRGSERVHSFSFTMDMAKRANLLSKDNWKKYQEAMLIYRAATRGLRAVCPEVLLGLGQTLGPEVTIDQAPEGVDLDTGEVLDVDEVFGGTENEPPAVSDEHRAEIRQRIDKLPEASVRELAAVWREEDIPPLTSQALTMEHVASINALLDAAESAEDAQPDDDDDGGELPYDETGRRGD